MIIFLNVFSNYEKLVCPTCVKVSFPFEKIPQYIYVILALFQDGANSEPSSNSFPTLIG
jgi:hypothetical protein